jgi:hypothetical protein
MLHSAYGIVSKGRLREASGRQVKEPSIIE